MNKSRHRQAACPLDLDPLACWVREQCRYWSRELGGCDYAAVKDAERKRRRVEEFGGSAIQERIRLTR